MKTLSIVQMDDAVGHAPGTVKIVMFSDKKWYEASLSKCAHGWDCALRLLPSQKTVTSLVRRKMVLKYLGLEVSVTRLEKSRVNNLHRNLPKYGYKLRKSHASKYPNPTNRGGYKVTDGDGQVVLGPDYDATLERVEEFLAAKAAEFKPEGMR